MLYDPHLDVFLKVAEAGSFSKAAAGMFITSSAVIKQVNLLEENLGVKLFERSHRGLKLTRAGQALYADAGSVISRCSEVASKVRASEKEGTKVLRIGVSPLTPTDLLSSLWPKIYAMEPDIQLHMVPFENSRSAARDILKNLGRGIDLLEGVFDEEFLKMEECSGMEIRQEKVGVGLPPNHPLAGKESVSLEDLHGCTVMLLQRGLLRVMDQIRHDIRKHHPEIEVVDSPFFDAETFNACLRDNIPMIIAPHWSSIHLMLKVVPGNWDYRIPCGFLYARDPDPVVGRFMKAAKISTKTI